MDPNESVFLGQSALCGKYRQLNAKLMYAQRAICKMPCQDVQNMQSESNLEVTITDKHKQVEKQELYSNVWSLICVSRVESTRRYCLVGTYAKFGRH